jgi:hypothetical protein
VTDGDARPGEDGPDPVGSVGEEAAKLLSALQDWATESGAGFSDLHEHLATGSDECRYCPVCRAISLVRQTSPEVRAHLTAAAGSLLQAAAGLMTAAHPAAPPDRGVQRIHLDDDPPKDRTAWDAE